MNGLPHDIEKQLALLSPAHAAYLKHQVEWSSTARLSQLPPEPSEQSGWLAKINDDPAKSKALTEDPSEPWSEFGVQSGRGFGKLLDMRTLIPVPAGWCEIGKLAVGDEVFAENGKPCQVVATFDDMPTKAYRLTFSDGTTVDACADHQWVTWTHRDRKQYLRHDKGIDDFPANWPAYRQALYHAKGGIVGFCGPEIRTTQRIIDTFTHASRGDTNHCVPVCGDLQLPEIDVFDPWALGYWLGNGTATDSRISCHDEDVVEVEARFAALGFAVTRSPSMPDRDFRAGGLQHCLKALGVLSNKHVPARYLRASAEQRRAMLAGLLDSDGHCAVKTGRIEFCSTDKQLAEGVVELARSLGQKPVLAEGCAKLNGKDCGPKYRVTWRPTYQPFSLPRKAAAWQPPAAQALRNKHRMITKFEEIEPRPMRCITVDSPNSMYLCGEGMIPTHNTRMGAEWLLKDAWEDPKALPRCVIAPTQADVKHTCFEGVSGLVTLAPPEIVDNYNRSELVLTLKNGGIIRGFSAEKPERLRGPENAAGWMDEVAAWGPDAEDVFDMFMFGLRIGDNPRFIWTSTPKPIPLIRKLTAPRKGRIIVRASTYENKANLSPKFLEKIAEHEGTRLGRQEIHGELIDPTEAGIIRQSWLRLWPSAKALPAFQWIVMSLDTAFTEKTLDKRGDPDPTACGVFGVFEHEKRTNIILLDCWQAYLGFPDLVRRVKKEAAKSYGDDGDTALVQPLFGSSRPLGSGRKPDIILVEEKGSGISLRQALAATGLETFPYNPGRADKLSRLHVVSPLFSQKRVWLPESDRTPGKPRTWCEPLVDQLTTFAGSGSIKHDDFVDVTTQALRLCMDKNLLSFAPEAQHEKRGREREREAEDAIQASLANGYENPYNC